MPLLRFIIGGVQKGGTTALARYLSAHPQVALPRDKEAHVFDAPDFDEHWDSDAVDARLSALFDASDLRAYCCGDATPITLLHERLVERVRRYNPEMCWIVLLRDPVERAISHYHMERGRGAEPWPMPLALLAESWRLRGHADDFSPESPLRKWSYAARGRYSAQLEALMRHFPREQVLLLRTCDLSAAPAAATARVLAFLGLPPLPDGVDFPRHFEGGYRPPSAWSPGRLWLQWQLRGEVAKLRDRFGIDLQAPAL